MKLHLGVIVVPYSKTPQGKVSKTKKVEAGNQTTGDVAGWLEKKYDVMGGFVDLHRPEIEAAIANSASAALESFMMGTPISMDVFSEGTDKIEKLFKFEYLDREEITKTGANGVPTEAALKGVNHRMGSKRGSRRSSFIDTGLYQSSFKVWVD